MENLTTYRVKNPRKSSVVTFFQRQLEHRDDLAPFRYQTEVSAELLAAERQPRDADRQSDLWVCEMMKIILLRNALRFYEDIVRRFSNPRLFTVYQDVFSMMPLTALVSERILCSQN